MHLKIHIAMYTKGCNEKEIFMKHVPSNHFMHITKEISRVLGYFIQEMFEKL